MTSFRVIVYCGNAFTYVPQNIKLNIEASYSDPLDAITTQMCSAMTEKVRTVAPSAIYISSSM